MTETYREKTFVLTFDSADPPLHGAAAEAEQSTRKLTLIIHRCGCSTPKHLIYCGGCGRKINKEE